MSKVLKTVDWFINIPMDSKDYKDKFIFSSDFTLMFKSQIFRFCISYNLKRTNRNSMVVGLHHKCSSDSAVNLDFDIKFNASIVNTDLSKSIAILKTCFNNQRGIGQGATLAEPSKLQEARRLICKEDKDGKLNLRFVITAININPENEQDVEMNPTPFTSSFFDKLDSIFQALISSPVDITINTEDGESFKAHKSVLSEKSNVFRAMFSNGLEESETKAVDVIDFTGPIMQELLRFIYFGNIENIEQINVELYMAADVYDIEDLRKVCLKSITSGVSADNVAEIVKFADMHDLHDLFHKCCDIISCVYSDDWMRESFEKLNMKLRIKILERMFLIKVANENVVVSTVED